MPRPRRRVHEQHLQALEALEAWLSEVRQRGSLLRLTGLSPQAKVELRNRLGASIEAVDEMCDLE